MFIEKIKTDGLAHFSYIVGDSGRAVVIDPQLDITKYMEIARAKHCHIQTILETHRNEDFISGAYALSSKTGAEVLHGPNPQQAIEYARTVLEGEEIIAGNLKLKILETPGHTDDSISIALYDLTHEDGAVGVFTGDTLFIGDVGRADFYPDRAEEMAGLLFDSLQKLLALGDQTILYPAHGAGSVCGAGMADREFSTIGHERRNNDRLKIETRDRFIKVKLAEHHYKPPYFKTMERRNVFGAAALDPSQNLPALSYDTLRDKAPKHLIDVRPVSSFLAAHIPGSISLPVAMISSFAGWMMNESDTIGLLCDAEQEASDAARHLNRIGYSNIVGFSKNMVGIAASGAQISSVPIIDTKTVLHRLQSNEVWTLLDVRSLDEFQTAHIETAQHCYVGEILQDPQALTLVGPVTVMCGSGARATVAASRLQQAGITDIDVYYGSYAAWTASGAKHET